MKRRFALGRIVFVLLAGAAAGCFALFPLDDYGPGNGLTDGGNGGDGTLSSSSSSGGLVDAFDPNARHVFITSSTLDGKIFGVTTPDETCRALASDAGLANSGNYKAWIAYSNRTPADRWNWEAGLPTVDYIDLEGRKVISSFGDLIQSGRPLQAIEIDERVQHVSVDFVDAAAGTCSGTFTPVWTNLFPDSGEVDVNAGCAGFATNDPMQSSHVGIVTAQPTVWTDACQLPCNQHAHLYCFEQ